MKIKSESSPPRSVRLHFFPERPSDAAFNQLQAGGRRSRHRTTQIRRSFINADYGPGEAPLHQIVQGGRAALVRLQLMLAFLWMAGGGDERHEVEFPARTWAELFDLDTGMAGQRRIRGAMRWLETQNLIAVERAAGRPPVVTLLSDTGSGKAYTPPAAAKKDDATGKIPRLDWHVGLPPTFWSNAWVLALSSPGLALLLVMLDMHRPKSDHVWISPELARQRYGLSEDTWTRGTRELEAQEVIVIGRQTVGDTFDWKRVRNNYTVYPDRLDGEPHWIT